MDLTKKSLNPHNKKYSRRKSKSRNLSKIRRKSKKILMGGKYYSKIRHLKKIRQYSQRGGAKIDELISKKTYIIADNSNKGTYYESNSIFFNDKQHKFKYKIYVYSGASINKTGHLVRRRAPPESWNCFLYSIRCELCDIEVTYTDIYKETYIDNDCKNIYEIKGVISNPAINHSSSSSIKINTHLISKLNNNYKNIQKLIYELISCTNSETYNSDNNTIGFRWTKLIKQPPPSLKQPFENPTDAQIHTIVKRKADVKREQKKARLQKTILKHKKHRAQAASATTRKAGATPDAYNANLYEIPNPVEKKQIEYEEVVPINIVSERLQNHAVPTSSQRTENTPITNQDPDTTAGAGQVVEHAPTNESTLKIINNNRELITLLKDPVYFDGMRYDTDDKLYTFRQFYDFYILDKKLTIKDLINKWKLRQTQYDDHLPYLNFFLPRISETVAKVKAVAQAEEKYKAAQEEAETKANEAETATNKAEAEKAKAVAEAVAAAEKAKAAAEKAKAAAVAEAEAVAATNKAVAEAEAEKAKAATNKAEAEAATNKAVADAVAEAEKAKAEAIAEARETLIEEIQSKLNELKNPTSSNDWPPALAQARETLIEEIRSKLNELKNPIISNEWPPAPDLPTNNDNDNDNDTHIVFGFGTDFNRNLLTNSNT